MRNRNEFVQRIDRYRLGQAQRLSMGVSLEKDFQVLRCSLVLAEGRGKFLKVRWIENLQAEIPVSIANACLNATVAQETSVAEFAQLRVDLTRTLANGINQLAMMSGVHSRMLMVVCVDEPGLWCQDYDGRRTWQPFCEPELLAESTGLTVVDALPSRDLAVGGRGWPLYPLPQWLMFADRNKTVAERPRLLVTWSEWTELTWFPESDGLDEELPAIRYWRGPGSELENRLICECGQPELSAAHRNELGAQGKTDEVLAITWQEFQSVWNLSRNEPSADQLQEFVQVSLQLVLDRNLTIGDVLKTLASHLARSAQKFLGAGHGAQHCQWVKGGALAHHGLLLSEINQMLDADWVDPADAHYDPEFLRAASAAMAGLMHLDQMPLTIPWLSGAELPRMLGRLTPGSPANWRRVIMEMGDCRPPVMKLREAV